MSGSAPGVIIGPRLEWAIKPSFVAYVEALPDGQIHLDDRVERAADGRFVFGADADHGALSFLGSVHFFGHHGVLDVTLADPRVEPEGDGFVVSVAVAGGRVPVATVDRLCGDERAGFTASGVAATDDGAYLLGGVYSGGTPLDPFTIHGVAA